jgi:hypothetical protein
MSIFLTLWGLVAAAYLIVAFTAWPNTVYEIEAGIRFLLATVVIGGARFLASGNRSATSLKK